ncbi:hypothetical protein SteCoe_11336 [Stentor coeruleus]|uniref:BAR domain-containing protein n=1 Tax=Stentor coeruleus TaxID=5963 RepID=A0A1R2CDC6_9CILI|nr:hypothetical protein SteCoe_11336 [Stentor coeruleus]
MERDPSARFDNKARDYKDLQDFMKKIIKTEESIIQTRTNFKKKWMEIANIENNQDLSRGLTSYSKALDEIERTHRETLLIMKTNALESLKKYPERLKEQRRSLSACSKAQKDYEESEARLKRLQSTKDQRKVDQKELEGAVTSKEEKKKILAAKQESTEKIIEDRNKAHCEDVKNLILLLTHSKLSLHADSLQVYTEAFQEILKIKDQ